MTSRYDRQIALPQIGADGQSRLAAARVFIIGLGGLGCPLVSYLAGAGVGHLLLNDFDTVDVSNLARQTLYSERDVGSSKAATAARWVKRYNPQVKVQTLLERLTREELVHAAQTADVIVDATDNIATRLLAGQVCQQLKRPLVFGAAIRWEGQYAVFRYDRTEHTHIEQLLRHDDEMLGDCAGSGIFGPVAGMIGTAMAAEVLKLVLGIGEQQTRLNLYDARHGWRTLKLPLL